MSNPTTRNDLFILLSGLHEQFRSVEFPAVTLTKGDPQYGESRYYVSYNGVKLGWVVKVGNKWHGYTHETLLRGRHIVVTDTRREAVWEVAHNATGRNLVTTVDVHEDAVFLLGL
jgi:hypothetical protein